MPENPAAVVHLVLGSDSMVIHFMLKWNKLMCGKTPYAVCAKRATVGRRSPENTKLYLLFIITFTLFLNFEPNGPVIRSHTNLCKNAGVFTQK